MIRASRIRGKSPPFRDFDLLFCSDLGQADETDCEGNWSSNKDRDDLADVDISSKPIGRGILHWES